jgi:hypothetical protein
MGVTLTKSQQTEHSLYVVLNKKEWGRRNGILFPAARHDVSFVHAMKPCGVVQV